MIGPFAVAVIERFGLRRSVCTALLILAVGTAATSLMTAPWQMVLLWGVVVGSGSGMVANVLGATVAGRWFAKRRGLVLGMLTASSATGQLVFLPMLASLAVGQGWRVGLPGGRGRDAGADPAGGPAAARPSGRSRAAALRRGRGDADIRS